MKQNSISNQINTAWRKWPIALRAVLTGLAVSSIGIAIWTVLLGAISAPWSILPMVAALWVYLKFFSGAWGTKKGKEFKRSCFRSIKLSSSVWKWGLTAAILFVIIVQASFVITFRLVDFPSEKFTADYKILDRMPLWVAWAFLVTGSIVAGICEETGFRGYMQAPLEKKYGSPVAILIVSLMFTLIHLSHSWAVPILPHIFFASALLGILAYRTGSILPGMIGHSILDIFDYSIWWSDLTGGFHKRTIFQTGMDLPFIVWSLVFILALFVFVRAMSRLKKPGQNIPNDLEEANAIAKKTTSKYEKENFNAKMSLYQV